MSLFYKILKCNTFISKYVSERPFLSRPVICSIKYTFFNMSDNTNINMRPLQVTHMYICAICVIMSHHADIHIQWEVEHVYDRNVTYFE